MSERIERIKKRLEQARAQLNTVFDAVGDRWETQVYSEGAEWNVRQIATHLMVTDTAHVKMVISIADGQEFVGEDFDLERYNRRSIEKRSNSIVDQIRGVLAKPRAAPNQWFDGVNDAVLDKEGRHGSMQILSIESILKIVVGHERAHAQDITKALGIK